MLDLFDISLLSDRPHFHGPISRIFIRRPSLRPHGNVRLLFLRNDDTELTTRSASELNGERIGAQ